MSIFRKNNIDDVEKGESSSNVQQWRIYMTIPYYVIYYKTMILYVHF